MKIVGITGSLASGKSTASKLLSKGKGPLFSADNSVQNLYKKNSFRKIVSKKLKIKNSSNIKKLIKRKIRKDKSLIIKLEKIVHPLVRKEMHKFIKTNRKKLFIFLEIPLLIESTLMKFFDLSVFIKAKKSIRLKRFISKGGNKDIFNLLDGKQLSDTNKTKYSDYVVVNEKNINILKRKLSDILKKYE